MDFHKYCVILLIIFLKIVIILLLYIQILYIIINPYIHHLTKYPLSHQNLHEIHLLLLAHPSANSPHTNYYSYMCTFLYHASNLPCIPLNKLLHSSTEIYPGHQISPTSTPHHMNSHQDKSSSPFHHSGLSKIYLNKLSHHKIDMSPDQTSPHK